ncbi:MAG TPA: polyprenol monophosphomannose synthase [Gaiellaceae bacterium]
MRKESAFESSIRSASKSNCSASSSFRGSGATSAIIGSPIRAIVCLPTFNELPNLEPMLRALAGVLRDGDRVLVIDDGSPDGTGLEADRIAGELDFVDVLHRPVREGLGPAYLAGFRRALDEGAELVLELDCDFSHDPADVPRLIAAAEAGADLVLGSRYVPGGSVADWGLVRRAISRGAAVYTGLFLHMGVHDPTGGFKCFRRGVLEAIDLDAVGSHGYAFQIEMTYRAKRAGFRVVELPIRFADRERGRSKMSRAIVLEAIWRVPLLRLRLRWSA